MLCLVIISVYFYLFKFFFFFSFFFKILFEKEKARDRAQVEDEGQEREKQTSAEQGRSQSGLYPRVEGRHLTDWATQAPLHMTGLMLTFGATGVRKQS